jgi:hypothetical protein
MSNFLSQLHTAARAKDLDVELVVSDGKPRGAKGREYREITCLRLTPRDQAHPVDRRSVILSTIRRGGPMSIKGVHLEVLSKPQLYSAAQLDRAVAIAYAINRGRFILCEEPQR